ncbi:FadR/GntR family transcriptional regulator [Bogoriella caseilytica]|uniref:GntR family transcriptional regulator n=1 Tax=Bogoriella caseilytica TaxID=56055 RepID=A0A3N2BDG3_9MICO|nr:FCD domain-containing protein [Bogoriella caseilytica]ROR73084.1 GntR family transcriptional regulator [Bogoriella caseilytica]
MAVTDDAIAAIKAMIRSGELQPGDRLPREADLAAAVGVSRNSLREAVRALSLVRILDVRQGDGTYVSEMSPENLIEALNFLLEFRQDAGVIEFFEVRRILEPAAAALAARTMTEASVRDLRALIEESSSATDVTDLVSHDVTFHAAVARGAGNSVLASIIESISMPTARARIWRGLTEDDAVARTLAEHQAIVDAIAAGDDQLASARTLSHVSGVLAWLRRAEDGGGTVSS